MGTGIFETVQRISRQISSLYSANDFRTNPANRGNYSDLVFEVDYFTLLTPKNDS